MFGGLFQEFTALNLNRLARREKQRVDTSLVDQLLGSYFGPYQVLKLIARGGTGWVFKAQERTLNRMVALKVLPIDTARDQDLLNRFYREPRTASQLEHPNVITMYTVGHQNGLHYIAMQYVNGRELSEIMRENGRMDPKSALRISRKVLSALGTAHQHGIVHCDVKPRNIMIGHSGIVKVMDFGISEYMKAIEQGIADDTGFVLGTPSFMSPEQCMGGKIDGRSDIYSLGMVLYQMLAGRLPFDGMNTEKVIQTVISEPMPSILEYNPTVSPEIIHILDRALSKGLESRYGTCDEMIQDINVALRNKDKRDAEGGRWRPLIQQEDAPDTRVIDPDGSAAQIMDFYERQDKLLRVLTQHMDLQKITGHLVQDVADALSKAHAGEAEVLFERLETLERQGSAYAEDFALWWDQRGQKMMNELNAVSHSALEDTVKIQIEDAIEEDSGSVRVANMDMELFS